MTRLRIRVDEDAPTPRYLREFHTTNGYVTSEYTTDAKRARLFPNTKEFRDAFALTPADGSEPDERWVVEEVTT